MTDLDPALVERIRDTLPGVCHSNRCKLPLPPHGCPCADPVFEVLSALGIPAAALNALAKGEAVVVPKKSTPYMNSAGYMKFLEMRATHGPSWTGKKEPWIVYGAMLAASPYRSDT